jgi:hypothetical protein
VLTRQHQLFQFPLRPHSRARLAALASRHDFTQQSQRIVCVFEAYLKKNGPEIWLYRPWMKVGLPWDVLRGKGGRGALEVSHSEHLIRLFTIEMTVDQTLGNWYDFIKPHLIVIIFLSWLCKPLF